MAAAGVMTLFYHKKQHSRQAYSTLLLTRGGLQEGKVIYLSAPSIIVQKRDCFGIAVEKIRFMPHWNVYNTLSHGH